MAKRYIEKEKNKKFKKVYLLLLIIPIIIVAIILCVYFLGNTQSDEGGEEESIEEVKPVTDSIKKENTLTSNLLNPEELNEEITSRFNDLVEDGKVIKLYYKLTSENSGKIDLYYNIDDQAIVKMTIDIESKEIEETQTITEDEYLFKKSAISYNLSEDIENDYNEKKESMDLTDMVVNIIITETEVVINVNPV